MSETSNWQDRAECRGTNPAIFFPPAGKASIEATSIARAICGRCPVIEECVEASKSEHFGTWAGLTARDRVRGRKFIRQQTTGEWFTFQQLAQGFNIDQKLLDRWRKSGRIEARIIRNAWHAQLSDVADEVTIHRKKSA